MVSKKDGWTNVTIPIEWWEETKKFYEENKAEMRRRYIRSPSHLVTVALIHFIETHPAEALKSEKYDIFGTIDRNFNRMVSDTPKTSKMPQKI